MENDACVGKDGRRRVFFIFFFFFSQTRMWVTEKSRLSVSIGIGGEDGGGGMKGEQGEHS